MARLQRARARAGRRSEAPAARTRQVLLDLLVEPRRVLQRARRRPDAARRSSGVTVQVTRRPDAAGGALAEIRERVLELTAEQSKLWKRELKPGARRGRDRRSGASRLLREGLAELAERFEREIYPVLTPLAVGPGKPFPYISPLSLSLGVFVRDPESGEERFARVKVPELLPRFLRGRAKGDIPPARARDRSLAHSALPEDGGRRVRGVPGHPRRRLRGLGRGRRPARGGRARAAPAPLRRHGARRGLGVDVEEMLERLKSGLGVDDDQIYRSTASSTWPT